MGPVKHEQAIFASRVQSFLRVARVIVAGLRTKSGFRMLWTMLEPANIEPMHRPLRIANWKDCERAMIRDAAAIERDPVMCAISRAARQRRASTREETVETEGVGHAIASGYESPFVAPPSTIIATRSPLGTHTNARKKTRGGELYTQTDRQTVLHRLGHEPTHTPTLFQAGSASARSPTSQRLTGITSAHRGYGNEYCDVFVLCDHV